MNVTSAALLIYLVKVRPMVSNYLNKIEIFNELILYICTGMIVGMSDYQPDKFSMTDSQYLESYNAKQNSIGIAYIVFSSLTIVATIGGILLSGLQVLYHKIKKLWQ